MILGYVTRVLDMLGLRKSYPMHHGPSEGEILFAIVGVVLIAPLLTWRLIRFFRHYRRQAKRLLSGSYRQLSWDKRDPILYLRSFYDDAASDSNRLDQKTPEELLTTALEDAGPCVCIPQPHERLPFLGAARIYPKDDDWQTSVKYLIRNSQLVVIHPHISRGLLWELKTVREIVKPEKLMISFLVWQHLDSNSRQKLYEDFRAHAEGVLGTELFESIGRTSFILFDYDWNPVPIQIPFWARLVSLGRTIGTIRETLRPYLEERGVQFGIRRYIVYFICALFIACLITLLGISPASLVIAPIFLFLLDALFPFIYGTVSRIALRFESPMY